MLKKTPISFLNMLMVDLKESQGGGETLLNSNGTMDEVRKVVYCMEVTND
jgi:hypothetical protein